MATRIQLRGDTAVNWTSTNPTLSSREIGIDTTNRRFKIGNGSSPWNSLSYFDADSAPFDDSGTDITADTVQAAIEALDGLVGGFDTRIGNVEGDYVDLDSAQTVGGVKTFSSPPVVPTPTGGDEAASKDYVDTTGVMVVQHGADATVVRPSGATMVIWYGSVQPTNMVAPDIVVRTDEAS